MYIAISHRDIHCCHVLDCTRNLRDSYASSTKRSKRLCHICVIPSPSALGASARWITPQRYAVSVSLPKGETLKTDGNARRCVLSFALCLRQLFFTGRLLESPLRCAVYARARPSGPRGGGRKRAAKWWFYFKFVAILPLF